MLPLISFLDDGYDNNQKLFKVLQQDSLALNFLMLSRKMYWEEWFDKDYFVRILLVKLVSLFLSYLYTCLPFA